jgi:tRNA A-37 threonylcarbamoyl transferase component Bud32
MLLSIRLHALKYCFDFTLRAMPDPSPRISITRVITRSAIATVAEGYDSTLGRKVLVKSFHPQFARDPEMRARVDREAQAIARISHPNVVQIHDLRMEGDDVALVLEFIDGLSLGELLKTRAPLPPEVALTIAVAILDGLAVAHTAGILHRDLKPDNVLVSDKGEVKITDFGMASLRDLPSVTMEGIVVGTPSYMSLEQVTGAELTPASDLFAVGLILFEMLTGRQLISGATREEAYQNALKYSPPLLPDLREWIPADVEPALRALLERSARKRPQSADEARQLLLAALPTGPLPPVAIADFLSGASVQRSAPDPIIRTARRHRLMTAGLMSALAVMAIGLTWFTVRRLTVEAPPADSAVVIAPTTEPMGTTAVTQLDTGRATMDTHRVPAEPVNPPVSNPPVKPSVTEPVVAATAGPGIVEITTRPWAKLFLGDSLIGTTPLRTALRLGPGDYALVFLNSEIGVPITRTARVAAGDTTHLDLNLYDFVARIRIAAVKPWADIYVDDVLVTGTPAAQTIFRPLGKHRVTLKHPDYPPHTFDLQFEQGDQVQEIRYDFTQH